MNTISFLTKEDLLRHWQEHRNLTRRTIEKFPEKELFTYSIGGMRPFAVLIKELLAIAEPGLQEIVTKELIGFDEERKELKTKEDMLRAWDEATPKINEWYGQISDNRFKEVHKLFGEYEFPVIDNILYFIDNEIHHRGQGFVYLRALGIEPPFFWDRG